MKKLLFLVVMLLVSCKENMPEAPFGLSWDMSRSDAVKSAPEHKRFSKLGSDLYEIQVPKPDFEDGLYLLNFEQNKLWGISAKYEFYDKNRAEKVFDYYDSLFSSKYGNKSDFPVLPSAKKFCIKSGDCITKSFQYTKGNFISTIIFYDIGNGAMYRVGVGYAYRDYLERIRLRNTNKQ